METILANCSASVSELKKNPLALIDASGGEPIAILNHNKPTAYLIPADTYHQLLDRLENYELGLIVKDREHEKNQAIEVNIDDL